MHAIDTERSPGWPSLMVTTRRRLMPQGTSFSFLQAVTQALHSMQRSASQRNFIRAMMASLRRADLAERDLGLLHAGGRIVAVGRDGVGAFAEHDGVKALRIIRPQVLAGVPAAEMERHPDDTLADPLGYQGLDLGPRTVLGAGHPDPGAVLDAAVGRIRRIDLDEHVLLQLGEPFVGARLFATAFIFDQASCAENQREVLGDSLVDGGLLHGKADVG